MKSLKKLRKAKKWSSKKEFKNFKRIKKVCWLKFYKNKIQENIWRLKKDQKVDNNFKKEFKKFMNENSRKEK